MKTLVMLLFSPFILMGFLCAFIGCTFMAGVSKGLDVAVQIFGAEE